MDVIVPIKRFSLGKQRLSERFSPEIRHELCRLMADWVMNELALTRSIRRAIVVTAESELIPAIRGNGFDLLWEAEHEGGLNASASWGLAESGRLGANDACVVHADLPLFSSAELERIIASHQRGAVRKMSLVSDRIGQGTNLRLCRPVSAIPCMYGKSSAVEHERMAIAESVTFERICSPTFELDLDTADDVPLILRAAQALEETQRPPVVTMLRSLVERDLNWST
ncbi:2-phospho-L-lactate guanylyltransferase [Paraburkholderia sp. SIMBA_030]|uniref:2-phospho-L-lactate guanylyltransferase n=1 Tax=Paraburkholderia sp. SIMBA_030 TaxID=3085773 RepID=UPI00397E18F2